MKRFFWGLFFIVIFTPHSADANESAGVEQAKQLCSTGNLQGCADLSAFQLEAGNKAEAKQLAKRACDGGNMRGCNVLGLIARSEVDVSGAKSLFKKSCENKNYKGCLNLAILYYEKGDKTEAKKLTKEACEGGEILACDSLGQLESEAGNKANAKILFKRSCEAGLVAGCTALGVSENLDGNKSEAERLWTKSCDDGDANGCKNLENVITQKMHLYQSACSKGDMSSCYNYGLVRQQLPISIDSGATEEDQILGIFQKACVGGEKRGCEEIRKYLTKLCIERKKQSDRECYKQGPVKSTGATSIISMVRINNPSCDAKLKLAELGLGCTRVGDLQAKQGNYDEAERIYSEGCISEKHHEGCDGLVCVGYLKARKGDQVGAKKLFKQACDYAHYVAGTLENCASKKTKSKLPAEIVKGEIKKAEEACAARWQRAWGVSALGL